MSITTLFVMSSVTSNAIFLSCASLHRHLKDFKAQDCLKMYRSSSSVSCQELPASWEMTPEELCQGIVLYTANIYSGASEVNIVVYLK